MNTRLFNQFNPYTLTIFSLLLMLLFSPLSNAAPDNKPIAFWSGSNENSETVIDHTLWQKLLDTYLDTKNSSGINLFNYAAISSDDLKTLNNYVTNLQTLNPRDLNRAEQKAYWINLYNALTVELILKNYPVKSITKIGKGFFAFGPWDDMLATIQGQELSLNNIEHGILRPFFKDNRIHYAVNCASMSCPNLSGSAYTASNTDELLEQGAEQYINHQRGVKFEKEELQVSSIYHWYKDDFGGSDKSLIAHLLQYAKPDLAKHLIVYQGDIDHDYDWSLNQP